MICRQGDGLPRLGGCSGVLSFLDHSNNMKRHMFFCFAPFGLFLGIGTNINYLQCNAAESDHVVVFVDITTNLEQGKTSGVNSCILAMLIGANGTLAILLQLQMAYSTTNKMLYKFNFQLRINMTAALTYRYTVRL
jgi:hypothetical protein